jgi:hypothetical protein
MLGADLDRYTRDGKKEDRLHIPEARSKPEIRSKNIMTTFTAHQRDERRTDKI